MPQIIKKLTQVRPGERIIILDRELHQKWPHTRGTEYVVSLVKYQGNYIVFQYTGDRGNAGRMKLIQDINVEVLEKTDILTLGNFLEKHRYAGKQPTAVKLNCGGRVELFTLDTSFWKGNSKNIRVKGLRSNGRLMNVPTAFIVTEVIY